MIIGRKEREEVEKGRGEKRTSTSPPLITHGLCCISGILENIQFKEKRREGGSIRAKKQKESEEGSQSGKQIKDACSYPPSPSLNSQGKTRRGKMCGF